MKKTPYLEPKDDEIVEKYDGQCVHCGRNTLLPYAYEWTCNSCGYNVISRKIEPTKIQRKKLNSINRVKCAGKKLYKISIDVYKIYESVGFREIFAVLIT